MKPKTKTYVPSMDGIPGLFPGNVTPVPDPDDEGTPVEHTPNKDNLRDVYDGSNAVRTLNRRMMQK